MSELKPCPFCGAKTINMMGYNYHKVCCSSDDCEINQVPFTIEAWNTRAPNSEWISVDDRLPFIYQQVLVCSEMADGSDSVMIEFYNGEKRGFVGINGYKDKFVTHWMSLPDMPETKK